MGKSKGFTVIERPGAFVGFANPLAPAAPYPFCVSAITSCQLLGLAKSDMCAHPPPTPPTQLRPSLTTPSIL